MLLYSRLSSQNKTKKEKEKSCEKISKKKLGT